MKEQASLQICNMDTTESFKTAAAAAELKGKMRMILLFMKLPEVLDDIQKQQDKQEAMKNNFQKANVADFDFHINQQAKEVRS
jgi:hypothetical protein